jgi:hypothetical protein
MKYSEYQVWYHAFNNAVQALANNSSIDIEDLMSGADKIANFVTAKFSGVEMPVTPDIDLQGLVSKVAKDMFPQK